MVQLCLCVVLLLCFSTNAYLYFASYTVQGPIDYKLYEAYGGGVGKAVSAVLNNVGATRAALGVLAGIVVRKYRTTCIYLQCVALPWLSLRDERLALAERGPVLARRRVDARRKEGCLCVEGVETLRLFFANARFDEKACRRCSFPYASALTVFVPSLYRSSLRSFDFFFLLARNQLAVAADTSSWS